MLDKKMYYLEKELKGILLKGKVDKISADMILFDINDRIKSFSYHKNDEKFINTLFFFTREEADFYEEDDKFMNNYLLLNVKNSKLSKYVYDEKVVKLFLDECRHYFISENILDMEFEYQERFDIYGDIAKKYHEVWDIIYNLANSENNYIKFEYNKNIQDVSDLLTDELKAQIEDSNNSNLPVFTDSIKCITRDMEELYIMLTFILQKDCALVTSNYYIANGYAEKRKVLLKAISTSELQKNAQRAIKKNLIITEGMSKVYKSIINFYANNL